MTLMMISDSQVHCMNKFCCKVEAVLGAGGVYDILPWFLPNSIIIFWGARESYLLIGSHKYRILQAKAAIWSLWSVRRVMQGAWCPFMTLAWISCGFKSHQVFSSAT